MGDADPSEDEYSIGVAVIVGFAGEGFDEHEDEEVEYSCDGLKSAFCESVPEAQILRYFVMVHF